MSGLLGFPNRNVYRGALHGLGHMSELDPARGKQLIESFLARHPDLPVEDIEYAKSAMVGAVQ